MSDYDLPDIYKQTMGLAKTMVANDPKMSIEDAMAKAGKHLGKQDKWKTKTKPGLEKVFGALKPSTFNQTAVNRLRNTPEVVAQRKQRANEFLDQPTEAWTPPRTEIQAFDRTRIKDALGGFPDVEQTKFQRDVPARSSLTHVHSVYEDPENRDLIKKQIARGLPLGGETFYASLYPVKLAAMEAGIPPEKFDAWIHSIAPASARNSILNEMAVGQAIRDAHARGSDLSPESLAKVRAEYKAKYGIGLPMMPVHEQGVSNVLQNNLNLRDLSRANIPTNYKIPTYGTQKAGDFAHSWVGDVHEATGETLGSEYHPYFTTAGGFKNPEYGAAENHMLDIAREMGIPGGTAQAGRWFGGGELTGLKSPRGDALDLLEKQVAYTLHHQGIVPTPQEVRRYTLQMIGTGQGHLLPWFKKAGMPDMRVKNKKEGGLIEGEEHREPSQDEMMAHIMLKGMANLKDVGANEAPNLKVKAYVPPAGGPGLPVGGVDFQPESQGQQMLPGQPPAPGQPPQAGGPPGQPPASPQGQNPNAPRSNILQMTPQGQAMAAMRASPPPGMPPPKMAGGGSTTPSVEEMKRALGKFLEGSHTPMRLYHGTTATEDIHKKEAIRRLKPSKEGALGSGVYLTPNAEFANEYADPYIPGSKKLASGNVLPVHARITNPLVIRSKRGQDPMIMALVQLGMTPEKAASMVEKAYEQKGYIGKQVQQRAQAAGHDALMQYRDGDLSEVVHYNPRMIKSATGNRGTYDTSKDDLSMATGGSTTPSVEEMKQALMDKDEPVRMKLKSSDNSASKRMIDDVYSKYPTHPFNAQQRAMAEGEGDDQTLGTFELKPSMSARNAVELSWLSAYPHKQGVGSRTLQKLQEHAAEHNVGLTLFPWEHGGVSQSKLIKFYKKHGFAPNMKGSKTMVWRPEQKADGGTVKDYIRITERKL